MSPTLTDLPQELKRMVMLQLSSEDVAHLRLVSKACKDLAAPYFLNSFTFGLQRSAINSTYQLNKFIDATHHIKTVVIDTNAYQEDYAKSPSQYAGEMRRHLSKQKHETWPEAKAFQPIIDAWRDPEIVDKKILSGGGRFTGQDGDFYDGYRRYQQSFNNQQRILHKLEHVKALEFILSRVPSVSTLEIHSDYSLGFEEEELDDNGNPPAKRDDWTKTYNKRQIAYCLEPEASEEVEPNHRTIGMIDLVNCWTSMGKKFDLVIWEGRSIGADLRKLQKGKWIPDFMKDFLQDWSQEQEQLDHEATEASDEEGQSATFPIDLT